MDGSSPFRYGINAVKIKLLNPPQSTRSALRKIGALGFTSSPLAGEDRGEGEIFTEKYVQGGFDGINWIYRIFQNPSVTSKTLFC
jgi:hypothetical protein